MSAFNSLSLVARLQQVAAEPVALLREFSPPTEMLMPVYLVKAARSLGFKAKWLKLQVQQLNPAILPVVTRLTDGSYLVIAAIKEGKILLHDAVTEQSRTCTSEELKQLWTGEVLHLSKRFTLVSAETRFGFGWFIPVLAKYKKLLTDVLVASFVIQLIGLATPIFFQVTIDKVLVHKGLTTLDVLAIGFFIVITFEVILTFLRTYIFSHTTNRVDVELGSLLYRHMVALPISYFAARRIGDTVARVKELDKLREFITGSSLTIVLDVFFSIVFFAVMFYYAPLLSWIVAGSIPFYIILSVLITPALKHRIEQKFQKSAESHAFLVESVSGIETIKAMAVEPQLRMQWEQRLADYVSSAFRASHLNNVYANIAAYINKLTSLLTLYFGALSVVNAELTVGQFIAFNMLSQRVSGPIMRLVNLWQEFQQAKVSVDRLGDVLNSPAEPGFNPGRATLTTIKGDVEFTDVSFSYKPDAQPVLNQISCQIAAGECIGVVGRSGSGKSTLTKLLQRLYIPQHGRITIDGADLALVEPAWLRRQIGVVLQDSFLFNRSIRDNIALTEPSMAMADVVRCAQLAGAHEFICELPEGYDTVIAEQGGSLSGGQRQRIAIARALASDPRILIFDEATSALDYESERVIQRNMKQICQGRTVLIIAHRLSAVRHCNRILVMDKGRIVEQGPHKQLLELRGIYHKLVQLQRLDSEPLSEAADAK